MSGVSRRTLQYYDNEGILPVKRSEENYRLYDETAMARLWEILWYKEMGFELKEIKNILTVTQKEKNNYLNEKIQIIEGKIQDLEKQIKFIRYIEQYGIIPIPINEKEKNINNKKTTKSYAKTIAVLGNGLDTIYPKENKELANMIINQGGTIISEYPLGTTPERMNFPARNRIVSGLSTGTLVIEAKEKSGTLITVDFALEQGKEVFVVPGNINSINSVGTNRLIKEGAKLVTCYEEIIEEGCY